MVMMECVGTRRFLEWKSHHIICEEKDTLLFFNSRRLHRHFHTPAWKRIWFYQRRGGIFCARIDTGIEGICRAGLSIVTNLIKQTIVMNFLGGFSK